MTVHDILSGADRSALAHLIRAGLAPLSLLHRAGLEAYLLPYALGVRKKCDLGVPTVAIGNLSSGGTGKTPMAHRVGSTLIEGGHRLALLSRGHGGSFSKTSATAIVSRGDGTILLSPDVCGDEPALLAKLLPGAFVIVGRDRRISGKRALAEFSPDVILLDDALQFWQLSTTLNIVLLDARKPFDNGWMLPRGLLREPPSHLNRAHIVVATRADRAEPSSLAALRRRVSTLAPGADFFTATHAPVGWVSPAGTLSPLGELSGQAARAVTAIADGKDFVRTCQKLGLRIVGHSNFPDHHAYNNNEIRLMIRENPSPLFVTTEKDRVKLDPLWPADGPELRSLRIGLRLSDDDAFDGALRGRLWR